MLEIFSRAGFFFCTLIVVSRASLSRYKEAALSVKKPLLACHQECVSLEKCFSSVSLVSHQRCTWRILIHTPMHYLAKSLGTAREVTNIKSFFFFQLKDIALFALPLEYDVPVFHLFSVSPKEMSVLTRITDC